MLTGRMIRSRRALLLPLLKILSKVCLVFHGCYQFCSRCQCELHCAVI